MSIVGIILVCMFILAIICCLPEFIEYLTNRRKGKKLEITKQIEPHTDKTVEQNTDKTVEQNTDKSDESQVGKKDKSQIGEKVKVDGIKCTIIDVDKLGKPCAWLSDVLPLDLEPPYHWCSREYAMSLKFDNGWHIPSRDELLKYEKNITVSCGSVICWTTTFYDGMCHYGNPHDIFGARRDVRIIKTI